MKAQIIRDIATWTPKSGTRSLFFLWRNMGDKLYLLVYDVNDWMQSGSITIDYLRNKPIVYKLSFAPHKYFSIVWNLFGDNYTEVNVSNEEFTRLQKELLPSTINRQEFFCYDPRKCP